MAGEFNLYSQYAQTQAPISQFVPDNIPWELILKQGVQKQAMHDKGVALRNSLGLEGSARYVEDAKYLKAKEDAVKQLSDEYAGKEMTGHVIEEMLSKFKQLKDDPGLATVAARTAEYDKAMKTLDEYAKDPNKLNEALAYMDFHKKRLAYDKSGAFDPTNNLTNVVLRSGVNKREEFEKVFNNLKEDKRFANYTKPELYNLMYKVTEEGVSSDKVSKAAVAALGSLRDSRLGEQVSAEYDMIKDYNPDAFKYKDKKGNIKEKTKDQYLLEQALAVGQEFINVKQDSTYDDMNNKAIGFGREDQKLKEVMINPGSAFKVNDVAEDISDLTNKINSTTDPNEKRTLSVARDRWVQGFGLTKEGRSLGAAAYNSKLALANSLAVIGGDKKLYDELIDAKTDSEMQKIRSKVQNLFQLQGEIINSHFGQTLNKQLEDVIGKVSTYEEALNDYAEKTPISVGVTIQAADDKTQNTINNLFKATEATDFKVIGMDEDEGLELLAKLKFNESLNVRLIDDKKLKGQELELTYEDDEGTRVTKIIQARGKNSKSLYANIAKNLGQEGIDVYNRTKAAEFVPSSTEFTPVPGAPNYVAKSNTSSDSMSLYKTVNKKQVPVTNKDLIVPLAYSDSAMDAALIDMFMSVDPNLDVTTAQNLANGVYTDKYTSKWVESVLNKPATFETSYDLLETARSLK